jgi:hypothetical protein
MASFSAIKPTLLTVRPTVRTRAPLLPRSTRRRTRARLVSMQRRASKDTREPSTRQFTWEHPGNAGHTARAAACLTGDAVRSEGGQSADPGHCPVSPAFTTPTLAHGMCRPTQLHWWTIRGCDLLYMRARSSVGNTQHTPPLLRVKPTHSTCGHPPVLPCLAYDYAGGVDVGVWRRRSLSTPVSPRAAISFRSIPSYRVGMQEPLYSLPRGLRGCWSKGASRTSKCPRHLVSGASSSHIKHSRSTTYDACIQAIQRTR